MKKIFSIWMLIGLFGSGIVSACDADVKVESTPTKSADSAVVQTPVDTSSVISQSDQLIRLVATPLGHKLEAVKDPENNVICYITDTMISCLQIKP